MSPDIPADLHEAVLSLPAEKHEAALEWLVYASAAFRLVKEVQTDGLSALLPKEASA